MLMEIRAHLGRPFNTENHGKKCRMVASSKKKFHGTGRLKWNLYRENRRDKKRLSESSSCIVLSDSDFETPRKLNEKKTSVAGKRKRTTKSASTSSRKKKRTETSSVGKKETVLEGNKVF